jgi:hypothetical protein
LIVDPLEVVFFRRFSLKPVDVAQGVLFVAEAVVWWDLDL